MILISSHALYQTSNRKDSVFYPIVNIIWVLTNKSLQKLIHVATYLTWGIDSTPVAFLTSSISHKIFLSEGTNPSS
jgi:uncharacterized PurR-regulated membrane protein YhhQ (DUF165 family)